MKNNSDKISPNIFINVLVVICMGMLGILVLAGYKGNPPITPHPAAPLVLGTVGLVLGTKTVYFSDAQIFVRRLLPVFNRNVLWESVRNIEVVRDRYILIVLNDCPLFEKSGRSIKAYVLLYHSNLIKIDLFTLREKENYVRIIRKYYPEISFIDCSPI